MNEKQIEKNSLNGIRQEIMNNWQSKMFIPHIFSNLTTIIVCFLCYGIYVLLDEYLHTILLSLLVGTSLKPIKNAFVKKLFRIIYKKDAKGELFEPLSIKLRKNMIFNNDSHEVDHEQKQKKKERQNQQQYQSEEETQNTLNQTNTQSKLFIKPKQYQSFDNPSPRNKRKDKRKSSWNRKNQFSQLRQSDVLRQNNIDADEIVLTIKQTILKIIWQMLVLLMLIVIFYFIMDTPGLVILFFILVGQYLIGVTYQIFKPLIKLFLRITFALLRVFLDESKIKKFLSKCLSGLFIILVIGLLVVTLSFSVFLIYKDILNIKQGINEDFIKKDFLNYSTHADQFMKFVGGLNVTKQLQALMPKQKFNYLQDTKLKMCISMFKQHTVLKLISDYLRQHLCNFYSKFDYQTIQNYLPIMKSVFFTLSNLVGLSFSSAFGFFNFIFLSWFKIIMFLSTTYFITQQFNIIEVEGLLAKFMNVTKSRTDKITDLFFEIKNIMFGSVKIAFLHFLLSWIIFDYFNITNFNFILSIFLGFMALVPVYHPFIGALVVIFCSWMYKSESSTILLLILCLVYLLLSNMIFSLSYSRISMPSLITNLSVILGIYSFGGLGVVYGPIIVTILRGIITQIKSF